METADDDEDLKLVQASASLLSSLESALPKILWRPSTTGCEHGPVHTRVKRRDLDYIIKLIEPFQGEPQLLDARLKYIVPPVVDAFLQYLLNEGTAHPASEHLPLEEGVCAILYTLCKVRGYKVIVSFFNSEARYLEPVLRALERTINALSTGETAWQVHYILLLWLSHLLLTPFDLASISDSKPTGAAAKGIHLPAGLPSIAVRCLRVGMKYLPASTKAQDAAASMLVRLVVRPDMQRPQLGEAVVRHALRTIETESHDHATPVSIYERMGPLRFTAGIAASIDLAYLVPAIHETVEMIANNSESSITSNAVAKKLVIKTLRNVAMLCLRNGSKQGPLLSLHQGELLENVIDYLLRSLSDRDTPVRYAAAKALSMIIQELEPGMGHEVIQAVLDTFKEDLPRHNTGLDFRNADPLKWHGLTLALAHVLFKRTASPEQLPDIINTLVAALQFEQRTSTGSSLGTNVRDAANFGIWSFSRRYTTDELLAVPTADIVYAHKEKTSAIQAVAVQLILSACLDPAGNIRRGSSAALQELIGRHPNQVYDGISLVQIVEYQAVGLRRRAMVGVSRKAAELHPIYWHALIDGVLGWRGVGSPDVVSREAAAAALAKLAGLQQHGEIGNVQGKIVEQFERTAVGDAERLHALTFALCHILDGGVVVKPSELWGVARRLPDCIANFSPRILRSELPSAAASMTAALCRQALDIEVNFEDLHSVSFACLETLTERMLFRQEEPILQSASGLARALLLLKRTAGQALGCIGAQELCKRVAADSAKSTLGGAGRAIALGALAPLYGDEFASEKEAMAVTTLCRMMDVRSVDWRVICVRAMQLVVQGHEARPLVPTLVGLLVDAVHCGLNDYTIDERGDVGSLVRLQAIACTSDILRLLEGVPGNESAVSRLQADIARLSLEKLDRVRLHAAQCREQFTPSDTSVADLMGVSTYEYFHTALSPLQSHSEDSLLVTALLEGCVSCSGIGAEGLLQSSRAALADTLDGVDDLALGVRMSAFAAVLKSMLQRDGSTDANNIYPALELLAFFFDMCIPQRLVKTDFKWRNLLSLVQKSHFKSNEIPKILAALHVYRGLADVPELKSDVLKKLISMLKTNPYPRVRAVAAETLFVITKEDALRERDWSKPASQHVEVVCELQRSYAPM